MPFQLVRQLPNKRASIQACERPQSGDQPAARRWVSARQDKLAQSNGRRQHHCDRQHGRLSVRGKSPTLRVTPRKVYDGREHEVSTRKALL